MRRMIAALALAASTTAAAVAAGSATAPKLTAQQIIEKNVAARGGLEAWRKIQTMIWVGHMETTGGPTSSIPFVLQQKRPNQTRFELNGISQKTLRVFDGTRGWKVRPASDGRPDVQSYTAQEAKFARGEQIIDGPLIDYQAKGNTVTLQGEEEIEGRKTYRLGVRLASGALETIWIDANTFLDLKYDRTSYNRAGVPGVVSVFYRNYKDIGGLQIPSVLEIGAGSARVPDKMVIEKIALNPPLEDRTFARPGGPRQRNMVTIEATPDPDAGSGPTRPSAPPPAAAPDPGTAPK